MTHFVFLFSINMSKLVLPHCEDLQYVCVVHVYIPERNY